MPSERIPTRRAPGFSRHGADRRLRERLRISRTDLLTETPPREPVRRPIAARRIALLQEENADARLIAAFRALVDATGAPIEWSVDRGPVAALLPRALAESDVVVTDRVPALRSGEQALLPRFHTLVRAPSAFGSAAAPRSLRRCDVLLCAPLVEGGDALRRSADLALEWAAAEGRSTIECGGRELWRATASAAAARRVPRLAVRARASANAELRRRLLFEPQTIEAVVAPRGDLDAFVRAACAGAGWSNRVPSIWLGDGRALVALDESASQRRSAATAESAVAVARAAQRVLQRLGERTAAARLGAAIGAELAARLESTQDLWLDLASDTVEGFAAAVAAHLAPDCEGDAALRSARDARSSRRAALG